MSLVSRSTAQVDSDEDAGHVRVRFKTLSLPQQESAASTSSAGFFGNTVDRLTTWMLPIGVAASFFAPDIETVRRRVRARTSTDPRSAFLAEWLQEDPWHVVLEPVTAAEIAELRTIWSLPYAGPVDFDYLGDTED